MLVSKFTDHLPLYRLEDILIRHGVHLSRSTLCDWVRNAALLLGPLAELQKSLGLQSQYLPNQTIDQVIEVAGRKVPPDHGFWNQSQPRREPCAHHHTLNRRQVHRSATRHLQEHVPLRDYKRKVTPSTLWAVVLTAAAGVTSIHATCGWLKELPSEETVRKALYACLPDFAELQRQLNRALAGRLPRALRRRPQRLAIDLTLIPYHGKPFRDPKEVYRGLAKDGTSHFHAYATAYVVLKGQRFTVALTAVTKGEPLKQVIQRLLQQARSVGVRPRLLLLDRGFYSVEVIRTGPDPKKRRQSLHRRLT